MGKILEIIGIIIPNDMPIIIACSAKLYDELSKDPVNITYLTITFPGKLKIIPNKVPI